MLRRGTRPKGSEKTRGGGAGPESGCKIVEMTLLLLVLLQGEPATLDGWLARARERYANGYTSESVAAWTKAIEINKERADFYVGRARSKRRGNDSAGAMEDLNKALQLAPDEPMTYVERGLTWEHRGNPAGAKDDYEKALSLDPDFIPAYFRRGSLRKEQNRHKEAEEDFRKAAAAPDGKPEFLAWRADAKFKLGDLLAAGPGWYDGALEDYSAVIARDDKDGSQLTVRASLYTTLGRFAEAEKDLKRAIELGPKLARAHFEQGRLMEFTGRTKESLASFTKAVECDPKYGAAYFGRGNAKGRLNDPRGAIADLNKVLELEGKWTSAYFNRALRKSELKEWGGAIADFNKVVELDDGRLVMAALCNRAWIKAQVKDEAGSKRDYARAAGMDAETPWQLEYRSGAKEATGNVLGAIEDMKAALEKSAKGSEQRAGIEKKLERLYKK